MEPFHSFYWSLQQGKLHDLFFKDSVTVATWVLGLFTLLLVLVTFLLVLDSWNKGREQRNRLDREDEQRNQDRGEERARWKREDEQAAELRKPSISLG